MVLLSHSQKVSIWGWLPLEIRSIQLHPMRIKVILLHPQHGGGLPAGGGMSTFSIGIQLANDIPFTGTRSKMGRSLMVREMFQIFQPIKQQRFRSMRIGQELFLIQSMVEQQKSERTGLHYLESMWVTKWLSLQQQ